MIIPPGRTTNYFLLFDKYYDDNKKPTELNFNLIRLYGNDAETAQEGSTQNSNLTYSMNVTLK